MWRWSPLVGLGCRGLRARRTPALELASLDLDEVPAMARQLAEELAIPSGDWLEDALYCWLQEAQQEAKIHRRVRGYPGRPHLDDANASNGASHQGGGWQRSSLCA